MKCSEFIAKYTCGLPYTFKHVLGEAWELVEAIRAWNGAEVLDELGDTLMTFQLWVAWKQPFDLPMMVPQYVYRKHDARMAAWEVIFEANDLIFSPRYLENGSNYNKPAKRYAAFAAALEQQER